MRKDKSCGNNTITLWDGEKEQTFDKGIGTHAASRIVYDVSDLGASRFEAYVGVDRELTGVDRDHANVDFQVMIDGEVVFEKTAMQHDTPMAKVSVDIPEGARPSRWPSARAARRGRSRGLGGRPVRRR